MPLSQKPRIYPNRSHIKDSKVREKRVRFLDEGGTVNELDDIEAQIKDLSFVNFLKIHERIEARKTAEEQEPGDSSESKKTKQGEERMKQLELLSKYSKMKH